MKLVHRIESSALDHLLGKKIVYLTWQELHEGLREMLGESHKVAMEYSPDNANPYISRVDAGTVELVRGFGAEVVSSGNLIQYFEARWTEEQWELHIQADELNQAAFDAAWKLIADRLRSGKTIREAEVQDYVMDYYAGHGMTTYHPPIVGVNANSGDPHYCPVHGSDSEIRRGILVLLDMWARWMFPQVFIAI